MTRCDEREPRGRLVWQGSGGERFFLSASLGGWKAENRLGREETGAAIEGAERLLSRPGDGARCDYAGEGICYVRGSDGEELAGAT